MALIAANRLTVTIPAAPDDPPADDVARDRIARWLEGQYGYRPPVESLEGHGWSAGWEVGGELSPGWRYDAVIPRHLGPSREDVAKARHPAAEKRAPAATRPTQRPAGAGATRARPPRGTARSRRQPPTSPAMAELYTRMDSLFDAMPEPGPSA